MVTTFKSSKKARANTPPPPSMETYPLQMIPASEPPVEGMSMRRVATKFSWGGFNVKQTFNVQNVY